MSYLSSLNKFNCLADGAEPNSPNERRIVFPPPPRPILFIPKLTNDTSLLSCLHHVRNPYYAITIAFCDIPLLSATITACLINIKHLKYDYTEQHNRWEFRYGTKPKFSYSILPSRRQMEFRQATLFYAALEAFEKFPQNFDEEDIDRRDQYRFVVDRHGGEDSTPPYCSGIVTLYYNLYNNTIILEIYKGDEIDPSKTYLTNNLIYDKIFEALKTSGFDASPFDNKQFQKDIQEKKHMITMVTVDTAK